MNTDTSHYAVQVSLDDDFAALMETTDTVYRVALLEDDGSELFVTHAVADDLGASIRDLFSQAAEVEAEVMAADCGPYVCGSTDHGTEGHPTVEPDGGTDGTSGMHTSQAEYVDPAVEQMDAQLAAMTDDELAAYDSYCAAMENPTGYCPCHGDDQRLVAVSSTGGSDPYSIDNLACGCRVVGFSGERRDQHCIEHDRAGDSPTPTLLVTAEDLSVGDVMVMPFDKRWTITEVKPFGPRSVYVRVRTEAGWTRLDRHGEVHVLAKVPDETAGDHDVRMPDGRVVRAHRRPAGRTS